MNRLHQGRYGVGRWLALFIFTLVLIGPAIRIFSFLGGYSHTIGLLARARHPYFSYTYYAVEQLISFAVQGYGVFAGIRLWRIRSGAVRQAKIFLFGIVLFAFADYIMGTIWIIVVTPLTIRASALSKFLSGQTAMALIETAIYAAVWYSYLLKSERVRVTFLQDLPTG